MVAEPVGDERGEVVDRRPAWRRARRGAPRPRDGLPTEPSSRASTSTRRRLEELAALDEPGRADLDVGAQRADRRRRAPRAAPWPRPSREPARRCRPPRPRGSGAWCRARRRAPRSRPSRSPQLVGVGGERLGLGGGVAPIGLDALQAVGGGGALGVELVELAGQRGLGLRAPRRGASGRRAGSPRRARRRWWPPSARSRASSSAAPVAPADADPDAPARWCRSGRPRA